MADINRIMNGYENATEAAEYAESIVCDVELNSGTDYTMVWSEHYDGKYPPER